MSVPAARSTLSPLARGHRDLLAAAVAIGLLALLLLVGLRRLPGLSASTLLLAAVGAATVTLVLVRPLYGVFLLPVVAVLVPLSVGTGTQTALVAALLFAAVLIALWIVRMLIGRALVVRSSPINLPLAGFVVATILSLLSSNVMRDPLIYFPPTWLNTQLGGLSVFVLSAGVLFVVLNALRGLRAIQILVYIFLATGVVTIAAYVGSGGSDLPGSAVGGLYSLWIVALAFGQAVSNRQLSGRARLGLFLLALAWLLRRFIYENDWLSGWLPAGLAVLVVALLSSRRIALTVACTIAIVGYLSFDAIYDTQVNGAESGGNALRWEIWEQNLEVTRDHLVFGTGPAGYAPYYMSLFPDHAWSSHSNYLDIFSQTGLLGSALFLWFLVAIFRVGFQARRRWPDGFGRGLANGAIGGLVGMVVAMALGDWLIPFVYNQTLAGFRFTVHSWIVMGAVAALAALPPAEEA